MLKKDYQALQEEINQSVYHGDILTLTEIARKLLDSFYNEYQESQAVICNQSIEIEYLQKEIESISFLARETKPEIDGLIEQNEKLKHRIPRDIEDDLRRKIEVYEWALHNISVNCDDRGMKFIARRALDCVYKKDYEKQKGGH